MTIPKIKADTLIRKTKLVCTIGPASESEEQIRKLMLAGMNVCRINFSHGSHEEHGRKMERIRKLRQELKLPIPIMMDTRGPEIRTGSFQNGQADFVTGDTVAIYTADTVGDNTKFSVNYANFCADLNVGDPILIDDGLVELKVIEKNSDHVLSRVANDGCIGDHKSVNLPNTLTSLPYMTERDIADITFCTEQGIEFVAASFVRRAEDVTQLRKLLENLGHSEIRIIAKIESQEGVNNFDEILRLADGIMVARGDLGVEIPLELVPSVQKHLIQRCYQYGKPCITATQMLDSMMRNPRPTRAEVSDVANAILDGTSAIMLSGETASGKYPLESTEAMVKIALATENSIDYWQAFRHKEHDMGPSVPNAIGHAACTTAMDLKAAAIAVITFQGRTARLISKFRPACPIIATTVSEVSCRQLNLSWGVTPFLVEETQDSERLFDQLVSKSVTSGIARDGDIVVMVGGMPLGMSGTTNTLKVATVGDILVKGEAISQATIVTGDALVIRSEKELQNALETTLDPGYILVVPSTNNAMIPLIQHAGAVIVEASGTTSHTAVACLALNIPSLTGCVNATSIIRNGSCLTVDFERGVVR